MSRGEERALAGLSVFRGSFDVAAAAAVANTSEETLRRLVAAGRLVDDGDRYRLAEDAPTERGVDEAVRQRHVEHYLAIAEWARQATPGPEEGEAWATMHRERENLVAAGDYAARSRDAELTVRLARCFQRDFSKPLGMMEHVRRWLAPLLERDDLPAPLRASAFGNATLQAALAEDWEAVESLGPRALALYRERDDAEGEAWVLGHLSSAARARGDPARADELLEQSLPLARRSGSQIMFLAAYAGAAERAIDRGDPDRAEELVNEFEANSRFKSANLETSLNTLRALITLARGDASAAIPRLLRSVQYWDEDDDDAAVAVTLRPLAAAFSAEGQHRRAVVLAAYADTLTAAIAKRRGPTRERYRDQAFAAAEHALSPEEINCARSEGAALSRAQAVTSAAEGDRG